MTAGKELESLTQQVFHLSQRVEEQRNSLLHLRDRVQELEEALTDADAETGPNPLPPFKPGLYVVGEFEGSWLGVYVTGGDWACFRHVQIDGSGEEWHNCPVLEVWDEGRLVWKKR